MYHTFRRELSPCPKCGMYSGERRKTISEPAKFCVLCTSCGYKTKFKNAINSATAEWEREARATNNN